MFDLDAYLDRVGLTGRPSLAQMHRAHATSITFENLDPQRGVPASLALADLERKLVGERRGGYCFEQNLLLMAAVEASGAEVETFLARVRLGAEPGAVRPAPSPGPARPHGGLRLAGRRRLRRRRPARAAAVRPGGRARAVGLALPHRAGRCGAGPADRRRGELDRPLRLRARARSDGGPRDEQLGRLDASALSVPRRADRHRARGRRDAHDAERLGRARARRADANGEDGRPGLAGGRPRSCWPSASRSVDSSSTTVAVSCPPRLLSPEISRPDRRAPLGSPRLRDRARPDRARGTRRRSSPRATSSVCRRSPSRIPGRP